MSKRKHYLKTNSTPLYKLPVAKSDRHFFESSPRGLKNARPLPSTSRSNCCAIAAFSQSPVGLYRDAGRSADRVRAGSGFAVADGTRTTSQFDILRRCDDCETRKLRNIDYVLFDGPLFCRT